MTSYAQSSSDRSSSDRSSSDGSSPKQKRRLRGKPMRTTSTSRNCDICDICGTKSAIMSKQRDKAMGNHRRYCRNHATQKGLTESEDFLKFRSVCLHHGCVATPWVDKNNRRGYFCSEHDKQKDREPTQAQLKTLVGHTGPTSIVRKRTGSSHGVVRSCTFEGCAKYSYIVSDTPDPATHKFTRYCRTHARDLKPEELARFKKYSKTCLDGGCTQPLVKGSPNFCKDHWEEGRRVATPQQLAMRVDNTRRRDPGRRDSIRKSYGASAGLGGGGAKKSEAPNKRSGHAAVCSSCPRIAVITAAEPDAHGRIMRYCRTHAKELAPKDIEQIMKKYRGTCLQKTCVNAVNKTPWNFCSSHSADAATTRYACR